MSGFTGARLSTAERLRELAWEGFTRGEIAGAAGCPVDVIQDLYDTGTGPRGAFNAVMRAWTKLTGPDVDEIAVERVLDGDYPPGRLTAAERREAIRQLGCAGTRTGRSPNGSRSPRTPSTGSSSPSASPSKGGAPATSRT